MTHARATICALVCLSLPGLSTAAFQTPPDHPIFESDAVHEIYLTFHQPSWWDSLVHNFEDYEDPIYMAAEFDWEGTHFDSVGVRFKGYSSYWGYPSDKKPFKIDFNEYLDEQEFEGLKKLNLNNGFKDPSFIRERSYWNLAAEMGIPYLRSNHAALYLNGEYWGLYTLIEQVDGTFAEQRFGGNEDGNLWKGDPHGDLLWLGPNESSYYDHYELKTNEEENDWSALVDFIDALNFTPLADRPDSLSPRLEIGSALGTLALNSLTVNLDSYTGSGHNYYLYHRDLDGRLVMIPWDANEAWGAFNMGIPIHVLKILPPNWMGGPPEMRPLCYKLWEVPAWDELYHGFMVKLMAGPADPDTMLAEMVALRDLIRPWVYSDTKKMFSNDEFEDAMAHDIGGGPGGFIPGLEPFIRDRHSYLISQLGAWDPLAYEGLALNELMADNENTIADEHGEYDDWIEIVNAGPAPLNLGGLSLTDDLAYPEAFVFPDITLDPGEYLLVWADDSTSQGSLHAPFKLDSDGESLYLLDGGVILDETAWLALGEDRSWGRWPDATGGWRLLSEATPGNENQHSEEPENIVLFINEFLAKNDGNIQDETGAYEDWVEIYNPGPDPVEMGGLFLTDEFSNPTQWQFPDTTLAAGGFLIVWCDSDAGDGPLHANFKLSAAGEEIGLYGRIAAGNELIDGYDFGPQVGDVSEGRESDGGEPWVFFTEPTPGASNGDTSVSTPPLATLRLLPNHPNPFNPWTRLCFDAPRAGQARLEVFDVSGRRVALLLDGPVAAGRHELDWNGHDDQGRPLPSGLYFTRLVLNEEIETGRAVLLR